MKKTKLFVIVLFLMVILSACAKTTTGITINFETNGGSTIDSLSTNGTDIELPNNPIKEGYIFEGWYFDNETFSDPYSISKVLDAVTNQITLYAKWSMQDSESTSQLRLIYELALEFESFTGTYEEWLETVKGPEGAPGEDDREIRIDVNDGYVRWQYIGSDIWTNFFSLSELKGEIGLSVYELYLIYHPEYTGSEEIWIEDLIAGNLNFQQSFNITFDFNDGITEPLIQEVDYLKKIEEPEVPIRENYIFAGWYIGDVQMNFLYFVALEDITLTAKWKNIGHLTDIFFIGVNDETVAYGEEFNVLDGVIAIGNNDIYYTNSITYQSTSFVIEDYLDTTIQGYHIIQYNVEIDGVVAQIVRKIYVSEPIPSEGEMLINADFSDGTFGWDGSTSYIADGAQMSLSTESVDGNPALKVDVVAGPNIYTPRFGQVNIPFEIGKTYEISFKAKSSVEKTIRLQLGELLSSAPWFLDFKEGVIIDKTITTDWQTYSFTFSMTQSNQRGGILFELGSIDGDDIDATLWFDDILIREITSESD